uniref:Uncharacterized protein n=2 Tax=Mus TaxID=862507 RepID=Q3UQV1_MOUSE|nr:unnamed protein product [Mus musculus]
MLFQIFFLIPVTLNVVFLFSLCKDTASSMIQLVKCFDSKLFSSPRSSLFPLTLAI